MNKRDYEPCSYEQNQYEMDIFCSLKIWLSSVTGVKWVAANGEGDEPDGQYGVISIDSIDPSTPMANKKRTVLISNDEACVSIAMTMNIEVTLNVFRAVKSANKTCTNLKTPADVLLRVFDAAHISRLSKYLALEHVKINDFGQINNMYDDIQEESFLMRSSMTLSICSERKTSYAENLIDGFCFNLKCKEREECDGD